MTFTVYACETVTGRNLGPLDCAVQSWARVLNSSETAAVQLHTDADGRGLSKDTRDFYRQLTEPARMSLVIDWDGIALWAGPVWNRNRGTNSVTVSAAGIGTILTRRKAVDPAAPPYASQNLAYSGLSLATIAKRLMQFTMARTGGQLPIDLPADEGPDADPTHVRNYPGSDLSTIGDLLTNLTGVIGGPDIDFRPVWTDATRTAIRWRMVTGTAAAPKLTSQNQLAWIYGLPGSGVRDLTVTEDASVMVTDQWARGDTPTGATVPVMSHAGNRTYVDLGWPLLEGQMDYTSVTDQATLDTHTAGDLAVYQATTQQWQLTVDAFSDPPLGSYQLGDIPTVQVHDDFWIPDGTYQMRILQIAGDGTEKVTVSVQDTASRGLDVLNSPGQSLPARLKQLERGARIGN